MNAIWILVWALAGVVLLSAGAGVLAGAGCALGLALILAPGSVDEVRETFRQGGGRFSTWMNRTSDLHAR